MPFCARRTFLSQVHGRLMSAVLLPSDHVEFITSKRREAPAQKPLRLRISFEWFNLARFDFKEVFP